MLQLFDKPVLLLRSVGYRACWSPVRIESSGDEMNRAWPEHSARTCVCAGADDARHFCVGSLKGTLFQRRHKKTSTQSQSISTDSVRARGAFVKLANKIVKLIRFRKARYSWIFFPIDMLDTNFHGGETFRAIWMCRREAAKSAGFLLVLVLSVSLSRFVAAVQP